MSSPTTRRPLSRLALYVATGVLVVMGVGGVILLGAGGG